jgi:prolyl oligopeptidase
MGERAALRKEIAQIARVERYGAPFKRGNRHFYLRFPASGPGMGPGTALVLRDTEQGPGRVLIDPAAFPQGAALAWAIPDPDGRRVAYLVTDDGFGWGTIRIREVESGWDLPDRLAGVRASGSALNWSPGGEGFFYERFELPKGGDERSAPVEGERIAFHRLGETQDRDAVIFESPNRRGWSLTHVVTSDGRYLVITATDGTTQHTRIHYRDLGSREGPVVELIGTADAAHRFVGNRGTTFWIWTDLDAPRGRVVSVDVRTPERARWVELIPEAEATISSWVGATAIGEKIMVGYLQDARNAGQGLRPSRPALVPARPAPGGLDLVGLRGNPAGTDRLLQPDRPGRSRNDLPARCSDRQVARLPATGARLRPGRVRQRAGLSEQ